MKKHLIFLLIAISLITGCAGNLWRQPVQTVLAQPAQKVALLLPLTGPLRSSSEAIKNGFLTAYYYDKQQNAQAPTLLILDTNGQSIQAVYQHAIEQGTDRIVGPLTKQNAQWLAKQNSLPVPTLALNTLPNYFHYHTNNLYQFGLSPLDEANQLATKIAESGVNKVMLFAPEGKWGQHIANTFKQTWQQLGGTLVGELTYPPHSENLNRPIRNILGLHQSEVRARDLKRSLHEKFHFVPRRRQDVGAIVMIALPQQARIIRPLLKYYYAGNLPVYSLSLIYSGQANRRQNRDLDGTIFCGMPWVLQSPQQLPNRLAAMRQRITSLWPNSFRHYPKLYALGIDAYTLTQQLQKLTASPNKSIAGATGQLFLVKGNHIFRQLLWAKMTNGQPQLQR